MASIRWTSHLPTLEQHEFSKQVIGSKAVLSRLETLLEEDYNVSDKEMHNRESFTSPAWAYKQAYELGYQKALSTILTLIKV